jgi:hypothetical protein
VVERSQRRPLHACAHVASCVESLFRLVCYAIYRRICGLPAAVEQIQKSAVAWPPKKPLVPPFWWKAEVYTISTIFDKGRDVAPACAALPFKV